MGTAKGAVSSSTVAVAEVGTVVNTAITEYGVLLSATNVSITAKDGKAVKGTAVLGTGMILNADGVKYSIVITGDTDGDGKTTVTDVQKAISHVRDGVTLGKAELDALAAAVGDTNCNILSVTKLLNDILGIS